MTNPESVPEARAPLATVSLTVNGHRHRLPVDPRRTLVRALREDLGLTGAKEGCGTGSCGACTVLLGGRAIYACLRLAVDCEGADVTTVEGLARDGVLHPVQQAFVDADALQCGYCTPGQILSVVALLDADPRPTDAAIRHALGGNLCRCGAYQSIVDAARRAASILHAES